jgi:hypothetical protein
VTLHRRRALLLGAVVALIAAGCGGAHIGKKGLEKQAESLQSLAAEGALLATDSAAGRTTRTYTREHASDLQSAAAKIASRLKAARTEPGLEPKLHRLAGLARRVADDLDRLGHAPRAEQRAIGHRLRIAAGISEQIASGP